MIHQKLTTLPDSFDDLIELETLDLYANNLKQIPTCLKNMKKLRRLDIGENDFGLPRNEVPEINFEASYPSRDPDLKNNWRGRNRTHLSAFHLSSSNEEHSTLLAALSAGSSIRKRHADEVINNNVSDTQTLEVNQVDEEEIWLDDSTCEKGLQGATNENSVTTSADVSEQQGQQEEEEEDPDDHVDNEECDDHVEEEPDDSGEESEELPSQTLSPHKDNNPPLSEECWDSEIIFESERRTNGIFRHPVTKYADINPHFFLPADIHVPPVPRNTNWFYVEEGQFDDADDL